MGPWKNPASDWVVQGLARLRYSPHNTHMTYDVAIVGGGPGGLMSGIYAAERKLSTVVLEAGSPGGQLTSLYPHKVISDFPGLPDIKAGDLAERLIGQARNFGAELRIDTSVSSYTRKDGYFDLTTAGGPFSARSIILAVGIGFSAPRTLGVPGENEAAAVYRFPEATAFPGRRVVVIGGGETAVEAALNAVHGGAAEVTIVHRHTDFRAVESQLDELRSRNVRFLTPFAVTGITKSESGTTLLLRNELNNEQTETVADLLCVHIGLVTDSSLVEAWGLQVENHAVTVSRDMQTSIPGIFACGDVTIPAGDFRRITVAVGQAAYAVHGVYKYLKNPYWK